MNKNKKLIIFALVALAVVILLVPACKKNKLGKGTPVVVTDEAGEPVTDKNGEYVTEMVYKEVVVVTDRNGVPVTDESGEAITVVLATEIVPVTNAQGDNIYDENGEVKTSIVYHPQEVEVPVTKPGGEVVTDDKGHVVSTNIIVPPEDEVVITQLPVTDFFGNVAVDENGNTITYIYTYTTNSVVPGDNNSSNWGTTFGGSGNDTFNAVAATPDGGCVALLQTNSKDGTLLGLTQKAAVPYMLLMKFNSNGKLQWQKAIAGNGSLSLTSVAVDKSGNIFAGGYSNANNLGFTPYGDYDAVLYKFSSTGDINWVKNFGGKMTDGFYGVSVCPDGKIVAAGMSASSDGNAASLKLKNGSSAAVLVKFDQNGKIVFANKTGDTGDSYTSVDVAPNGTIYAVGNFSSSKENKAFKSFGRADVAVVKFNANGARQWVKQYGGTKIENFRDIVALNDGCVICGRSQSNDKSLAKLGNQGGYDAVAVKYNADGNVVWNTAFRGSEDDSFTSIKQLSNGSYVLCGYSSSGTRDLKTIGNKGLSDGFVVTLDKNGKVNTIQGYGGTNKDQFDSICVLSNGEYIACGSTLSTNGDLVGGSAESNGKNTVGMIAKFK